MRVSAAVTTQRVEQNQYNLSKNIKAYGQNNDYPQKVLDIVDASGTGKVCVDIYTKFIVGAGLKDTVLGEMVLNDRKERANSLLRKCAKDLRKFNGFAVLVKYNGLAEPCEYYNVPFEHCRIEIDRAKQYTGRIAIHPDWTGIKGLVFKNSDIKYVTRFNPDMVIAEMVQAGSPEKYLGQIMYFTVDGDLEYPICPFDAVITDMLTEESVSTVKHRNAKFNFLPSGILVRKGKKFKTTDDGTLDEDDPYNQEQANSAAEIKRMQGDNNTSKIWVVDVDGDEEIPQFIPFDAKNYDKQYQYTEGTVQENIARMSFIPPILRGIDTGNKGFGSDLMNDAFNFMNSITKDERRVLEVAFMDLMALYPTKFADYSLQQLAYITAPAAPTPTPPV
jgi:hypothetical protein